MKLIEAAKVGNVSAITAALKAGPDTITSEYMAIKCYHQHLTVGLGTKYVLRQNWLCTSG